MKIIKAFIKFGIVGLSGVAVNMAVYTIALKMGLYYILAAVMSFLFAVSTNFFFNFVWTFRGIAGEKSIRRKYVEFFGISLLNFGVNLAVLKWLVDCLGVGQIAAQFLAIAFSSGLNFAGNYLYTFSDKGKRA